MENTESPLDSGTPGMEGETQPVEAVSEGNPEEPNSTEVNTTEEVVEDPVINEQPSTPSADAYSYVRVVSQDGTTEEFKTESPSDSENSILASANTQFDTASKAPAINKTERADAGMRKAWSLQGEKPTDVTSNINKYPDAETLEKASEKYGRKMDQLDDVDQRGRRVNAEGVYQQAERVKLLESIKKYEKDLTSGRPLTKEETEFLKEKHLQSNTRYKEYKTSYEAKGLTPEDQAILLGNHFKKDVEDFEKSLRNKKGDLVSTNCSLDQLVSLRDRYKKDHLKAYSQDRNARMESSDDEFRQGNIDEFMKENPDWSPKLAQTEQSRDVAMRENELLREKLAQQEKSPEEQEENPEEIDEIETPEEEQNGESTIENRKKQRDYKTMALIAGAVVGTATGTIGGVPAASVGMTAVLVGKLSSFAAGKLAEYNIRKLSGQIATEQDQETKGKLERKLNNWNKVVNVVQHMNRFLAGAGVGLVGSGLASQLFFGGKGVFEALGAARDINAASNLTDTGTGTTAEIPQESIPTGMQPEVEVGIGGGAVGGGAEELIQGDWFDTTNLGWDVTKFNWRGPRLFVPSENVVTGGAPDLQGKFLRALFDQGVGKNLLTGQQAGEVFNQGLIEAAYRGGDIAQTAQSTADALRALAQ